MDWLTQIDTGKLLLFALVLARTSGLVMTAPIYGSSEVPMQVRGLLAAALAALVLPTQWHAAAPIPDSSLGLLLVIASELAVGLTLGMGVTILFAGLQSAGQVIAQVSGLSIAEVFDPSQGEEVSIFGRLLFWITMAVFVAIGGQRLVMSGLLDTFRSIPPGTAAMPVRLADTVAALVAESFSLGIRASAPLAASLLLANLLLGLIGRTLPQLNILLIGFGVNSMLALGALSLTVGAVAWVFQDAVEPALARILEALAAGSAGTR
jgi:flagellar biosynthetic protein FliR